MASSTGTTCLKNKSLQQQEEMGCFYLTVYFVTCPLKKKQQKTKLCPTSPPKTGTQLFLPSLWEDKLNYIWKQIRRHKVQLT